MPEPRISDLSREVVLCSQKDVVNNDGELRLSRESVRTLWAKITTRRATTFSTGGLAMMDDVGRRTHVIHVHYQNDIDISVMAWVYEKRGVSSPRWYKILRVGEEHLGNHWFVMDCRLFEKSEDVITPGKAPMVGGAVPLPKDVNI